MESNCIFYKGTCAVVCVSLIMVIVILMGSPAQAANDCYKHITLKNEGAYVANATVTYSLEGVWPPIQSGNFSHGDTKRIPIPCDARFVKLSAKAIGGKTLFEKHYTTAKDHCYWVSGISAWDNFYTERCL